VPFDESLCGDDLDRRSTEVLHNAHVVILDASDAMIPPVVPGTSWTGTVSYIRAGDARAAAAEIQAGYPEVARFPEVPASEG
jgi:hypothetical protein